MWNPIDQTKRNEIIYALVRDGNEPKRFEELRSLCEAELSSRTTFNLYLKQLVEEGIVRRTIISRKNVLYQLNARKPQVQAIIEEEKIEQKTQRLLSDFYRQTKGPKPKNEEERRIQFCEALAFLFTHLDPEGPLFWFVESRAKPKGVPKSYLEYTYRKIVSTYLFKILPRELERLRRRDPDLFECGRMALETYRGDSGSLVSYLLSKVAYLRQLPKPPTMAQIRRDEEKRLKAGPTEKKSGPKK